MADYFTSTSDQPHPERTRAILKAHPEVRQLMGRNPWTGVVLALVVALQLSLAAVFGLLGFGYWWLALIVAYLAGAFANHSLYVIIHEATHNLIFANRRANKVAAIVADVPNVVPAAIGFSLYHLKHHAHQGDYFEDADISSDWEARLVGNRWYMKALWLLLFPFFQLTRPMRMEIRGLFSPWTAASILVAVAFAVGWILLFGWMSIAYLFASTLFSIGLHPLGARWIQEHYTLDATQETFSYYGILNIPALNVGYHNEHHDFPSIPWNRLPELRRIAPEFYDNLRAHSSWGRLLLTFIFDPQYTLHSRVLRSESRAQRKASASA